MILLIITGVAIITLNIDFILSFPFAKMIIGHGDPNIDHLIFFSISGILCIAVFILTVWISDYFLSFVLILEFSVGDYRKSDL